MSTREMTRAADSATSGDAERGDCVISRGRLGVHGDLTAYQGLSAAQFGTSAARVGDMATSTLQLAVVDDHPAIPVSYTHLDVYKRQGEVSYNRVVADTVLTADELAGGTCLTCRAVPEGDVEIEMRDESLRLTNAMLSRLRLAPY